MDRQDPKNDYLRRELIRCQQLIDEMERLGEPGAQASREARAMFEEMFELSPDALILVDRQARIVRMNAEAERLFGFARKELIGKDHGILVPDQFREMHEINLKAYMKQPRTRVMGIGLDLRGRRKDGSEFATDIDLGPLEIGGELFVLSVVRDATRRKELEDERNKLEQELAGYRQRLEKTVAERTAEFARTNEELARAIAERRKAEEGLALRAAILDNTTEAVFLVNTRGDFAFANATACRTYGYSQEEFLSMNLAHLLRPQDAPAIPESLEEVVRTGQMDLETVHVRKDGLLMPIKVHHTLIKTLHGQFIVTAVRVISSESPIGATTPAQEASSGKTGRRRVSPSS